MKNMLLESGVFVRTAVSNEVATGHRWLFEINYTKLKITFLACTSHISSAQGSPVTSDGCWTTQVWNISIPIESAIGQHSLRIFSILPKTLMKFGGEETD